MKLGIMQPYFFPYIGYFSLIDYCDHFVFFDTPQYIRKGWVNRNRLINLTGSTNYIIVPTQKAKQETPINKILIDNSQQWREKIYGQLTVYKKRAPYYNVVLELMHDILDRPYVSLSELNIQSIRAICECLGIAAGFGVFSKMNLDLEDITSPDEWALSITKKMGYSTYINPPGGMSFFDRKKYISQGIDLKFLKANLKPYQQKNGCFEPGLSIIDVMMFNNTQDVNKMIKDFEILI